MLQYFFSDISYNFRKQNVLKQKSIFSLTVICKILTVRNQLFVTIFNYKELYGQIVLMNIHVKIYDPLKVNFLKISCSILKQ